VLNGGPRRGTGVVTAVSPIEEAIRLRSLWLGGGPTRYKIDSGIKLIPMNNAVVTRRRRAWKTGARTPQMSRSFSLKG